MIYELVLSWDEEIIPYPEVWERHRAADNGHPSTALTMVNKLIRQEAQLVLYSKNQWRLAKPNEPGNIFHAYSHMFRKVKVSLDVRDLPNDIKVDIAKDIHSRPNASSLDRYEAARYEAAKKRREIHSELLDQTFALWTAKLASLENMPDLKKIVVDLENVMCPSACCRSHILTRLLYKMKLLRHPLPLENFAYRNMEEKISVMGLLTEEEYDVVEKSWRFSIAEEVPVGYIVDVMSEEEEMPEEDFVWESDELVPEEDDD